MDPTSIEIILVENGSTHEVKEAIIDLYGDHPQIKLIINETNRGFTKGNADIVESIMQRDERPEYIALLNNDTVVAPDWLNQLIAAARQTKAAITSSKMINYYDRRRIDNVGHFMLNTGEILPLGHRRPKESYNQIIENLGACGGAALYKTSMIQSIGFFDLYFDTGYEDAEFGLRAKLLGYKCILAPDAIVYHKVSRSINKIKNDKYLHHIQKNIFYTYIKLMPSGFLLRNSLFVLMKYMMWLAFGVFTLQFKLIGLHARTLYAYINQDFKQALESRNSFYQRYRDVIHKNMEDLRPVRFFVFTDVRRLLFHLRP